MQARLRLVLLGVLTLVFGLIIFFPARVAYHWFAPPVLRLGGIEGTVWNGSAREVLVNGVYLSDLHWRNRPLQLLSGKLGYAIEANPVPGFVEGNVAIGVTGSLTVTDLVGSLSLESLQQAIGVPGLRGNLSIKIEHLRLEDGLPVVAIGTIEVADLLAPIVHRASIGGYKVDFLTQDAGIMASVEDTDGIVDLAGSLALSSDRTYSFVALIAVKASTPADIRQQLHFLGSANDRGQYELRLEGQL
ncbi:MAG: type II secretion system protein N [Proteobacteria bacterium]|nr:type II secretion system protein N [Pseudomonadota bacterium]